MKRTHRLLSVLIAIALGCSLLAGCAGGEPDPNWGIYNAVSSQMMGFDMDYEGDFIELKKGGKARAVSPGGSMATGEQNRKTSKTRP